MTIAFFILLGIFIGIVTCAAAATYQESRRNQMIIRTLEQYLDELHKAEAPTKEYEGEEKMGNANG